MFASFTQRCETVVSILATVCLLAPLLMGSIAFVGA